MGLITLRTAALSVLGLSSFVFIALFGRLPIFRKTPIGFLHRLLWIHIPHGLARIDSLLLGGRLVPCCKSFGRYIAYENHPLVLIFFVGLLSISELMFVPKAWPRLGTFHRAFVLISITLPYIFLYACVTIKCFITPDNVKTELAQYPYDRVLFHPGNECSTCRLLKPARSKHCSTCKACVSRHDHHCIWLTNCVGRQNYRYFLALLLSLSVMLTYGMCLGYKLLNESLQKAFGTGGAHWSNSLSWTSWINYWALAVADDIRIGAVFLLAGMTAPLAFGFLVYHIYLVWAGTTTNETAKWDDWKEDIAYGLIYKAKRSEVYKTPKPRDESIEPKTQWSATTDQVLIITNGEPPRSNSILQAEGEQTPVDPRFKLVRNLQSLENLYDLGFWDNLRDALNLNI
ncbi:DHHC zinc finger membrane protein [Talaromyces stipitatus ATCC 10500]|uniref:Palmitoyltransferase n=1 Tax=Talaromyces stipitatus (strain ATCC 10500 / CBS 375.48 / QM 6759 / NRRL 1006) TaxID=441959 RepID=B8LTK6_TALSN|nr:DHHC zinc finger membrane protein [Talaromyces stipitatus ATCC 10500]EED23084.1 DHHC zinc finger membrane protein [Talaromyces stipitatus ATCC 10500]